MSKTLLRRQFKRAKYDEQFQADSLEEALDKVCVENRAFCCVKEKVGVIAEWRDKNKNNEIWKFEFELPNSYPILTNIFLQESENIRSNGRITLSEFDKKDSLTYEFTSFSYEFNAMINDLFNLPWNGICLFNLFPLWQIKSNNSFRISVEGEDLPETSLLSHCGMIVREPWLSQKVNLLPICYFTGVPKDFIPLIDFVCVEIQTEKIPELVNFKVGFWLNFSESGKSFVELETDISYSILLDEYENVQLILVPFKAARFRIESDRDFVNYMCNAGIALEQPEATPREFTILSDHFDCLPSPNCFVIRDFNSIRMMEDIYFWCYQIC